MTDSAITTVESVNDGLTEIEDKGLSDEVEELCEAFASSEASPNNVLDSFDWTTEHTVGIGENRPRFDGFKNGVGLEHESREQMNVRSHLLWMEAAYQKGESEERAESFYEGIDMGIFVIPTDTGGASVRRTKRELGDEIFTRHFPIECPILLVEYEVSDSTN